MKKIFIYMIVGLFGLVSSISFAKQYYGQNLCGYEQFKCVKVKRGDTWTKLFPDKRQREIVKRFNRTNIPLHYRSWLVVPTDLSSTSHMDLAPFPDQVDSQGKKLVVVDLSLQAFAAYDDKGDLVHWGPVSGGKDWCNDVARPCRTAVGEFKIYRKQGAKCESTKFPIETDGGAPMPYCMHYYGGFALHGSTLPGFHASHGCIRLFRGDAKWLNEEFTKIGTRIIVRR
ncbi:MAG: L,D-transpeptidase [Gammaproteobacteria bacterium]|nr:L,D-transpeptidase [Gammaproteobacteria bacterium]